LTFPNSSVSSSMINGFLVAVLLILTTFTVAFGDTHKTYEEALAASARNNKSVLVVFGAKWCNPCKQLDFEIKNNPSIKAELNSFNMVHIDIDDSPALARKYEVGSVPKIVVADKTGRKLHLKNGYLPADNISGWLRANRK